MNRNPYRMSMKPNDLERLIQKYLAGTISPEEKKQVDDWFGQESQSRHMRQVLAETSPGKLGERMWRKIMAQSAMPKAKSRVLARPWRYAAAVLLLAMAVAGVWWAAQGENWFGPGERVVSTGVGEKVEFALYDGTRVRLNAQSTLTLPKRFAKSHRTVTLVGEAFFEVAKQPHRPFLVHTGQAKLEVLGTAFNVNTTALPGATLVSLLHGKLAVSAAGHPADTLMLNPGEVARVGQDTLAKRPAAVGNYLVWFNQRLVFQDMPLPQVARQLSEIYAMPVVLDEGALGMLRLTATMPGRDIHSVVKNIAYTLAIDYTIRQDSVYLHRKNQ